MEKIQTTFIGDTDRKSLVEFEELFKLDFKEWKIQNRQDRPRTRDFSVNGNSLISKIYKWFEEGTEKIASQT